MIAKEPIARYNSVAVVRWKLRYVLEDGLNYGDDGSDGLTSMVRVTHEPVKVTVKPSLVTGPGTDTATLSLFVISTASVPGSVNLNSASHKRIGERCPLKRGLRRF